MTFEPSNLAGVVHPKVSGLILPEPLRAWNETVTVYPREKAVAAVFEEVVAAHPGSTAVVFGSEQLTYAELNQRANRLAHKLRGMGVGAETMVGCCIERSLELIVALVGVLKAGGAYVPLDPSYPKERFEFLVEDTRTPVILTEESVASTVLAGLNLPCVRIEDLETPASGADNFNPPPVGGPASLAYVMYTSGSTGQPKGVMVENRAIVRLVRNTTFCRFGPDEVFLQFAPISFDASTFEIWGPLLNGGRLVVMPPGTSSLEELGRVIIEQSVTTLWLTAGIFNLMVEQRLGDLKSVRQLLAGGEVLSPRHVRMVLNGLPNCRLINGYGPTENTTFTCCHTMRPGESIPASIPIGRPISNTQVYILDEELRPVPPGQTGEIYAGGDGVARGYLNHPEATAEKFLLNPFAAEPGARMYRTGDLGRWQEDGVIEFLGRIDTQVKILGHRIEPGEVETVLRIHKGVSQVCVVPHTGANGAKRLVAYYAPTQVSGVLPRDLRDFLRGKLPQYMMPALFVPVSSMPLSPNGKIDRSALPEPVFAPETDACAERPATHLEQTIANLWMRVLQADSMGLDDNFFDAGGDSLLLVAVHSSLQKALQVEIPVTDLFEFTTIRTLAKHLSEMDSITPSFSQVQQQAQKQRQAFAQARERRASGAL